MAGGTDPVAEEPGCLESVVNSKQLLGGAQVLFYGRFGQEEAIGYLGVAQAVGYEFQYLPSARRERVERLQLLIRYSVHLILKQLPRRHRLTFRRHLEGAYQLSKLHFGVDVAGAH